jgi:hypothetical protein
LSQLSEEGGLKFLADLGPTFKKISAKYDGTNWRFEQKISVRGEKIRVFCKKNSRLGKKCFFFIFYGPPKAG